MKWHVVVPILIVLLLPFPLLCWWILSMRPPLPRLEDAQHVPMLADWQRAQLLTYGRECQRHADCAAPLKCFLDPMDGRQFCTDSRCLNDKDCPTDLVCRTFSSGDEDVRVHRCVPLGVRREGEPCLPMPSDQQRGCVAGLLCQHDWCGRPCALGVPSSCPQSFFCAEGPDGPSCLPTCRGRACPQGQECVEFGSGSSICAEIHGEDCLRTPCSDGHFCYREQVSHQGDAVWMSCQTLCGDAKRTCPDSQVCFNFRCRQACTLDGPNTCGSHRRCGRLRQESPWCIPDP
jgi:hypothetical protein